MVKPLAVLALCLALLIAPFAINGVEAHESRPLYVDINERAPNEFDVTWRVPASALGVTDPVVVMPDTCRSGQTPPANAIIKRQLFSCTSDLAGAEIRVVFPRYNPSISTLFRLSRHTGEIHTVIAGPNDSRFVVPAKEETSTVAKEYLVLGVEHILFGFDHLLFVACLTIIAGSWRRVLLTVTGFTIAHSITLALAALNILRVPVPPVEAAIALSIVFLATEIARNRRDTLTWRYPIAVAGTFGLLHGFGFASVLSDIGLPQTEIVTALLFFNIGVELGQIAFVIALVVTAGLVGFTSRRPETFGTAGGLLPVRYARPTSYVIGALASFWLIERVVGFVV